MGRRSYQWLDAGADHSCAVTSDGRALCWGNGGRGQIGDGKTYLRFTPQRVAGGLLFRDATAGGLHSCGLATEGRSYCGGTTSTGQLGDRATTTPRLTPVTVVGGPTFTRLTAGENFTCGQTSIGGAYCWGGNWVGQLGDGTTIN